MKAVAVDRLDENSRERFDEFIRLSGSKPLISITQLVWLAVIWSPPVELKVGERFKKTGETVVLQPHTMVVTQQKYVGADRVEHYVERLARGKKVPGLRITDIAPGEGWWHLDGMHRLLAARILGRPFEATVWR